MQNRSLRMSTLLIAAIIVIIELNAQKKSSLTAMTKLLTFMEAV